MPENTCVESMILASEVDKKVASADVRLGDLKIKGLSVWRSANGKLSVFLPSHRLGHVWEDSIILPEDLMAEVEADVIAVYRARKKESEATPALPLTASLLKKH